MSKIFTLFSVLAAFLLLNALPAFSGGTGPYGSFGPSVAFDITPGSETQLVAFSSGTGPYGSFGPSDGYNVIPGAESQHVRITGTGPYGVFGPSFRDGAESSQFANKDECLLVAMNCPPGGLSGQQKIDRLNTEISKGTDVYTEDELRVLKDKLDDAYRDQGGTSGGGY
jgi:hypothetical protein